jgi:hypothetical protein
MRKEEKMKKKTLRSKWVGGGIVLLLIPLSVIGAFAAGIPVNGLTELSERQPLQLVQSLAKGVQLFLGEEMRRAGMIAYERSIIEAADQAGRSGAAADGEVATANRYLAMVRQESGGRYEELSLLGANGAVVAGQGRLTAGIGASSPAFQVARTGKIGLGNFIRSDRTGKFVVQICVPLRNGRGEFTGALSAVVGIDPLIDRIGNFRVGQGGFAFLVDGTGRIIADPGQDLVVRRLPAQGDGLEQIVKAMVAQRTGSEFYADGGAERHIAFTPVRATGWSVAFTQGAAELRSASRPNGYLTGAIVAILLLVVLALVNIPRLPDLLRQILRSLEGTGQGHTTPTRVS